MSLLVRGRLHGLPEQMMTAPEEKHLLRGVSWILAAMFTFLMQGAQPEGTRL